MFLIPHHAIFTSPFTEAKFSSRAPFLDVLVYGAEDLF